MKRPKSNQLIGFALFLFGLAVGWFFSLRATIGDVQTQPWQVKREVGVSDAITFLSALIIGYLLTSHKQKQIGDERTEKDTLMKLCDDAESSLNASHAFLRKLSRSSEFVQNDYHEITSLSQELSKALDDLKLMLAEIGYDDGRIDITPLDNTFQLYSDAIVNEEIENLVLSPETITNERLHRNSLSREIRNLKFKINRL